MLKHSSRRFYGFGYNKLQISCTTKVLTLLGAYYLTKNYHFNMKLRASVQVIYNILTHASILHDFTLKQLVLTLSPQISHHRH